MKELTYEEFCAQPMPAVFSVSTDWGSHRMLRNEELGIQREIHTQRNRHGDIYSGWKQQESAYILDGDDRQFSSAAELYVAWMHRVCGVEETDS